MQWAWPNPFFHLGSRDRDKKAFLIFFPSVRQGAVLSSAVTFCHSWCPFTLLITTHSKPIRQINGIKSHQGYQRQSAALSGNCRAATAGACGVVLYWGSTAGFCCASLLSVPGDLCRWTAAKSGAATPACGRRNEWGILSEQTPWPSAPF